MDTNRFRKRTNYALPPKRPVPILDEMGQLRPAPVAQPQKIQVTQAVSPKPETLKPVYQQAKADNAVIDLSEPAHGGWLDAITPEPDDEPIVDIPEALASPAVVAAARNPSVANELVPEDSGVTAALEQPQTNISIQISMPSLSLPKLHWPDIKLPDWPYRHIAIWTAVGAGSLIVLAVGGFLTKDYLFTKQPLSISEGAASLSGALQSPTFTPAVPKSKPQLAQGKSQATAFDGKRDSYSFTDSVENVPLTVSEQPIPASFNSASQAVSSIAKSMSANHSLKAGSITAYEAKSDKTSTQTIIFSEDNLLFFIQSNFSHDDGTWESYISSLQQPAS